MKQRTLYLAGGTRPAGDLRRMLVAIRRATSLAIPLLLAGCGGGGGGSDGGGGGGGLPATASAARGAQLYDKWWSELGVSAPATTSPDYPVAGTQTGSNTWRCTECHGWDYKGSTGVYATGTHFTGIAGVLASAGNTPEALFASIEGTATSHDFAPLFTANDVWDLVAFVKNGALDPSPWIDATGSAIGSASAGSTLYASNCASCHGATGSTLDLGSGQGVGDRADADPWQALHHIRWGVAGSAMPSMEEAGLSHAQQAAILAYAQTLTGTVTPPPPPPPPTLSYATDIRPIWAARSCTGCHGTSGGLTLTGTAAASYAEVTAGRVNTSNPASSLILRKPLTSGVSHGGGQLFASTSDVDYQKILTWITQGALNN